jgi:hypothetical protein
MLNTYIRLVCKTYPWSDASTIRQKLYLFLCYAGYSFSVATHHICRFTASSLSSASSFVSLSVAHLNSGLPLLFLSSSYQFNYSLRLLVTSPLLHISISLTLSNQIFLPTAHSPTLICFGWERGWWITCNYPTILKEKNVDKHKEYNLRYLLAKVHTTWGKASDRLRQRANKHNKNCVRRLLTSEGNRKIILSDEVRRRIGKG